MEMVKEEEMEEDLVVSVVVVHWEGVEEEVV